GAARASLEKKVDLERKIARLQPMVDEGRNTAEGLKTELYAIQLRLDESNRKMSELETRKRTVDAREALEKLREQLGKESAQEADEEDVLVREVKVDLEKRLRELEQPGAEFDRVELQERLDAEIETLGEKNVSDDKGTND
ncbi:MAG: phage shock protein A, partial [Candidatus Omnitrophota bacterium]